MPWVVPTPTPPARPDDLVPTDWSSTPMTIRLTLPALTLLALSAVLWAEEWPGWRGPRGDGTSAETGLPTHWGKGDNVAWSVPIPGTGHSSPVVWGDRVFVTTGIEKEEKRDLLCLDRRDGRLLWQ